MKFLSKLELKELFNKFERNTCYHPKLLNYSIDISSWYHHHGINCNDRKAYKNFLSKRMGINTYTFIGNYKYTNWGIKTTNGTFLMLSCSVRGTDYSIIPNKDINKNIKAVKELRDFLYKK